MTLHKQTFVNGLSLISLFVIAPFVAAFIPYRNITQGQLIGNIGDARWTVSIFEHWFRFVQGKEQLTSTLFFYPAEDTLGFSDAFLGPGLVYSGFRFINLDPVSSWALANFFSLFLANLGLALLSTQIFKSSLFRIFFVLIGGTSYGFITQIEHPQTIGYGFISWILFFFIYGIRNNNNLAKYAWPLIGPMVTLLALSSWYPTFFLFLTGAIWLALYIVIFGIYRIINLIVSQLKKTNKTVWIISFFITFTLSIIWITIYLPAAKALDKPWTEYLAYAPQFSDILNTSLGNPFWSMFVNTSNLFPTTTMEQSVGLTPVIFVLFGIFTLLAIRIAIGIRDRQSRMILITVITIWVAWAVVIVDDSGLSLFRLLWEFLPGATSIRVGFRINIILGVAVVAVVLILLEKLILKRKSENDLTKTLSWILIFFLLVLLFLEQQRTPPSSWYAEDFAPSNQIQISEALNSNQCDSFLLVTSYAEGTPGWLPLIDSISISVMSGVPSVLGYSGNTPPGFPSGPANVEQYQKQYLDWAKVNGDESVCLLDSSSASVSRE